MPYASTRSLLRVLDLFADGAVVLNESKDVIQASEKAKQYAGNGIELRGKKVFARDKASHAGLEHALDRALSSRIPSEKSQVVCLKRQLKRPLLARVVLLDDDGNADLSRRALLILCDPEHRSEPSQDLLMQAFEFTSAEARVARQLACGESLEEIAQQHGVALGTVRSQVKAIFAKAGTRRQVELVALLGRVGIAREKEGLVRADPDPVHLG